MKTITTLIWGTWFGSLIMLFLAVTSIFQTFADRHDLAGLAASGVFHLANRLRLGLALAMVIFLGFAWLLKRSRGKSIALALVLVAGGCVAYSGLVLTPHIDALRVGGLTKSPEFARLHGLSMGVYLLEALLLLVVGLLLPHIDQPSRD